MLRAVSILAAGRLTAAAPGPPSPSTTTIRTRPTFRPLQAAARFGLDLRMTAPCGPDTSSGTRLFRWKEPIEHPDLYYKVWYYFPRTYTLVGNPASWFWNIFGWKSKTINPPRNETFWHVNVYNRPGNGSMYLQLRDAQTGEAPAAAGAHRCAGESLVLSRGLLRKSGHGRGPRHDLAGRRRGSDAFVGRDAVSRPDSPVDGRNGM